MQKRSSKLESTRKTEQNRSGWKFLTMVKVNGQWSKSTVKVNSQRLTCADVAVWRHLGLTWQEEKQQQARVARECAWTGACGAREAHDRYRQRVAARGACAREAETSASALRRVWCRFLAVLSWVLLGIGCSVFLCLFFGSWMRRTLISECCRYCGRDGGGSLLIVTTGWRRGQRKNAGDVHKNQKVRGMALILC